MLSSRHLSGFSKTLLFLLWACSPVSLLAAGSAISIAPTLTFTINGSAGPLTVQSGSRLELLWSAAWAAECRGDWTTSKLAPSGKQTGRVSKSRSFTIVCTGKTGLSASRAIIVNLMSASGVTPAASRRTTHSLRVLSPNGDEVWYQGESRAITWTITDASSPFVVDVFNDRDVSYALPTSTVPSATRSYQWLIPLTFPIGRYKARVLLQNGDESDTSDEFFSVRERFVGVTRPLVCGSIGDVDGDGVISPADAGLVRSFAYSGSTPTPGERQRADVDVNGVVANLDAYYLESYLSGNVPSLPGCTAPGVSVDARINGIAGTVTVTEGASLTLSWSSNGGRCVIDDATLPPSGSLAKGIALPPGAIFAVRCFAEGSTRSASSQVTVSVGPPNRPPLIFSLDKPTAFRAGRSFSWEVTASDPDDTLLTFSVNWGDGGTSSLVASTTSAGSNMSVAFTHTVVSPGTYLVTTTVRDRRGAENSNTTTIVVTEVPRTSQNPLQQFGALFEAYQLLQLFTPTPCVECPAVKALKFKAVAPQ